MVVCINSCRAKKKISVKGKRLQHAGKEPCRGGKTGHGWDVKARRYSAVESCKFRGGMNIYRTGMKGSTGGLAELRRDCTRGWLDQTFEKGTKSGQKSIARLPIKIHDTVMSLTPEKRRV